MWAPPAPNLIFAGGSKLRHNHKNLGFVQTTSWIQGVNIPLNKMHIFAHCILSKWQNLQKTTKRHLKGQLFVLFSVRQLSRSTSHAREDNSAERLK